MSFPSVSVFIYPLVCLLSVLLSLIVSSHLSLTLYYSPLFSPTLSITCIFFSPTLSFTCVCFSQFSHYLFLLYFKTLYLSSIYLYSFLSTSLPVGFMTQGPGLIVWIIYNTHCLTSWCYFYPVNFLCIEIHSVWNSTNKQTNKPRNSTPILQGSYLTKS